MAWRNQGITGSNNIPLGKRRMGADDEEEDSRTATPSFDGPKRGRSPVRGKSTLWYTSETSNTYVFFYSGSPSGRRWLQETQEAQPLG